MKPAISVIIPTGVLLSFLIPILVFLGWILNIEILKSVVPGFVAMNPLTASCFLIISLSLYIIYFKKNKTSYQEILVTIFISLVSLTGLLRLTDYLFDIEMNIDQILFYEKVNTPYNGSVNRMAPNTAFNILIMSFGLLLIYKVKGKGFQIGQFLLLISLSISLIAIIGYVYSITNLYQVSIFIPMALHTAFLFLTLSVVIICLTPEKGILRILTNDTMGSSMARSLLPMAIIIPFALGFLFIQTQRKNLFTVEIGLSGLIVAFIVLFSIIIWINAKSLNKTHQILREAESKIKELQKDELKKINNEIDRFVYSASHDLRAPLTTMMGLIKVAKMEEKINTEIYLPMIEERVLRLDNIIRNIIDYSKNSRVEVISEDINFRDLVNEALNYLKNSVPEEFDKVEIRTEVPGNLFCYSDKERLVLVLKNLISNSIAFRKTNISDPTVWIHVYNIKKDLIIKVEDNGIGIPSNIKDKIFDMHFRGTERSKGAGLGLYIVKDAIQKLNGSIELLCSSQKTCFTIQLPFCVTSIN